jgi:ketosteroid isomerase-like protein
MSQENVEIVRRAFATEGIEELMAYLDPEIEWTTTGMFLDAATYRGHEGVRGYLGAMEAAFDDLRDASEEIIDAGEVVLVAQVISGRDKRSGARAEFTRTSVCSVRDGKIVHIRSYRSKAEALEAAGLSE